MFIKYKVKTKTHDYQKKEEKKDYSEIPDL